MLRRIEALEEDKQTLIEERDGKNTKIQQNKEEYDQLKLHGSFQ